MYTTYTTWSSGFSLAIKDPRLTCGRPFRTLVLAILLAVAWLNFADAPVFAEVPVPSTLVDDYTTVPQNGSASIEVLVNADLRGLARFEFSAPEYGSFISFSSSFVRQTLTFNCWPSENFVGQDKFVHTITDRNGYVRSATVYITVYAALSCSTRLVRRHATPINITFGSDGAFNVHFIGDGGVATGPVLLPVKELIELHAQDSGNVMLFEGTNSISGAQVLISYLSAEQFLHVHTFYPDRHDGSMKPYIFIVDQENEVSHWEW